MTPLGSHFGPRKSKRNLLESPKRGQDWHLDEGQVALSTLGTSRTSMLGLKQAVIVGKIDSASVLRFPAKVPV